MPFCYIYKYVTLLRSVKTYFRNLRGFVGVILKSLSDFLENIYRGVRL